MEEIIKELEKILEQLEYQEMSDVYVLAVCQYTGMALEEVERNINENSEQDEEKIKKKVTNTIYNRFREDPDSFTGMSKDKKEQLFDACKEKVQKDNKKRTRIIYLLQGFIDFLKLEEPQIFLEFEKLAELFQNISISINTQLSIVGTIAKMNSNLDDTKRGDRIYLHNSDALLDYTYKYMDYDELYEILRTNQFDEFIKDESYPNKLAQREVKRRYEETKLDYTDIQRACDSLSAIFDKDTKETTEEDYQTIIDNMNTLHFGNLAYRFIKKIKKQNEIEQAEEAKKLLEEKSTKKGQKPIEKEAKPMVSQREINHVYYEASKYFDFDLFKPKTLMNLDEIIYILSLLYSIDASTTTITKFLDSVMRQYKKNNPFVISFDSIPKFKSIDSKEVQEHVEMLEYILSDFNLFMCDDETYTETKKLVSDEISAIMEIINGDYTYEIKEAKALLKKAKVDSNGISN